MDTERVPSAADHPELHPTIELPREALSSSDNDTATPGDIVEPDIAEPDIVEGATAEPTTIVEPQITEPEALPLDEYPAPVGFFARITELRSDRPTLIKMGTLLLVALISIFLVARITSSATVIAPIRESLEDQQNNVSVMAASAAGLSVAITALPGDIATPIADQLAGLTGYFVIITGALIVQKMATAVVGQLAFMWIIPLACLLGIAYYFRGRIFLRTMAIKLTIFAIVLFAAVPASIGVSALVTEAHADSVSAATAQADQTAADAAATTAAADAAKDAEHAHDYEGNWLSDIRDWASNVVSSVEDTASGAVHSVENVKDEAVTALNGFMEKIALFIVTTCVVPIITIMLFAWVIRILFGFDINVRGIGRVAMVGSRRAVGGAGRAAARRFSR
ncbi:MAG: hypothetical protein LBH13_05805 [Cellulomonadaceae bacterium]|nr:hypothetical protein [Cellulomonadaceae bacterium]